MLFLTPTYHTAAFSGLRIVALFNEYLFYKKKTIRIINFQSRNSHTSHLFKQSSILKLQDKICLENTLFISKSLSNLSRSVFNTWFSFSSDQHNYEVWEVFNNCKCCWVVEQIQKQLKNILLKDLPPNKTKTVVSNFYFKSY